MASLSVQRALRPEPVEPAIFAPARVAGADDRERARARKAREEPAGTDAAGARRATAAYARLVPAAAGPGAATGAGAVPAHGGAAGTAFSIAA